MPDGSVSGFDSWGCFKPSSQPHHASVSVCWREQLWQTDFQWTEGKRESLEWLEELSWERAEWKQMSETLTAKTASVCMWVCVFGSCVRERWYILKVKLFLAASISSVNPINLCFVLCFYPHHDDRSQTKKWRCSGTPEFLRNRKSPSLECQTMQS